MESITFTLTPHGQDCSLTVDLTQLLERLSSVPDQRKRRGVRYPLAVLLAIAVLAKLCGSSQVHALADWARERAPELASLFKLKHARMPHPTTWTRVLGQAVSASAVETALAPLLIPATAEIPQPAEKQVAIDGKSLRGTWRAGAKGVHLLSAYEVDTGATLLQLPVGSKANELVVAPQLLAKLNLRGVLVTGDAMFAQRNLSTQIVEAGGDYLWIVKENQPRLYDDLRLLFGPQPEALPGTSPIPDDFVTVQTIEKGHGRLEERRLTTSSLLGEYSDWPYLAQAFMVVRTCEQKRGYTREVRYGITSASASRCGAERVAQGVRKHWRIENSLHHRRDVSLEEDASRARVGQAPQVLATLNNYICGISARAGIVNLAALQRTMAATFDRWLFRR